MATMFQLKKEKGLDGYLGALLFALGTLLSGSLAAWLSFTVIPPVPAYAHLPWLYPPPWVFWLVWIVIYPCKGLAAWLVWRERSRADVRGAMAVFTMILIGNMLFLPIANLSGGNPLILTLMDFNGVVSSWIIFWLYRLYSKAAGWFLLPLVIWMPVTFLLKCWLWYLNG